MQLKASERRVEARESNLMEREARINQMVLRASESLSEARKLVDDVQRDETFKIGQVISFAKKMGVRQPRLCNNYR
jgi:hypothetical protein